MTTDLKPCPFCGGAPYQGSEIGETGELDWFVACGNYCGAACQTFDSQDEADQAWNRRAPTDDAMDYVRTLKELTLLRCLVLDYFRVKKYAAEALAPGGTTADRETWANAEMEAEEAMRKAVMG